MCGGESAPGLLPGTAVLGQLGQGGGMLTHPQPIECSNALAGVLTHTCCTGSSVLTHPHNCALQPHCCALLLYYSFIYVYFSFLGNV